tara:strand:- start:14339 stop:14479 length:141 start_codon:yes stop_codon:yes gene_type:complete
MDRDRKGIAILPKSVANVLAMNCWHIDFPTTSPLHHFTTAQNTARS